MHCIKTIALAALVAVRISAFPLGSRELATADDLVKRNYALDVTDDKRYYGRKILSSRDADATKFSPNPFHVSSSAGKYVKRVAQGDNDGWNIDINGLYLPFRQSGALEIGVLGEEDTESEGDEGNESGGDEDTESGRDEDTETS